MAAVPKKNIIMMNPRVALRALRNLIPAFATCAIVAQAASFDAGVGFGARSVPDVATMANAAVTGSAVPAENVATAVRYQGLWSNPGEPGWAVGLTHQGDTLFGTWFTYGENYEPLWFTMPEAKLQDDGSYVGDLLRTFAGVPFTLHSFSAFRTGSAYKVGSARFVFTDANHGTFTYTVNDVTLSRAISRQLVDGTVPTCSIATSGSQEQDFTGHYASQHVASLGFYLNHHGDNIFAVWYSYDPSGNPTWFVMPDARRVDGYTANYRGTVYKTIAWSYRAQLWNPAMVAATPIGKGEIGYASASSFYFKYIEGSSEEPLFLTRLLFAKPLTACR